MQEPPTQCRPAGHGEPAPHIHAPVALHALALTGLQVLHAPPLSPHCETVVGITQIAPAQQPPGHVATSQDVHTPDKHNAVAGHAAHAVPVRPHAAAVVPGRQELPLQQPAHDVESHTHVPAAQR